MKTKFKLISASFIVLVGVFAGAGLVSAQTATIATCTSATLNGTVTDTNGVQTSAWFEWGTNYNNVVAGSGTRTATQVFSVPQDFSQGISGLTANTTYYYRVAGSNTYGVGQGGTLSFTTPSCGTGTQNLLPLVTTNGASSVSQNSATLNGYVTPNGSNTNAWFEWSTSSSFGNSTNSVSYGTTATSFSNSISGLAQNTTYYYRAVAQNSQGTVYGSQMSFTTSSNGGNTCGSWGWGGNCGNNVVMVSTRNADTSGDFAILNGYVDPVNTNDTVRWFEWGGSQALGNSTQKLSHGSVASNFSASLTGLVPNTTYYYRASARNSQGTVYGNTLSFTTGGQTVINNNNGTLPAVTTLLSTELTGTTAKLNGLVFTSANQPSNAWFEWGTNSTLGNKTQTFSVGMLPTIKHSDVITGLVKGQTYYYRIVAENPYGKVQGSIYSFVSDGNSTTQDTSVVINTNRKVVTKPTVTVVNRGSSTQSLVALSLDGGAEVIVGSEKRSYHVVWKNESNQSLSNVVLRIAFPQTMSVESTTKGAFSSVDNTVTIDVKTLAPGESGEVFITAIADRGIKAGELVVVTANMVYTTADGVQGDAIAYVTHRAEVAVNNLGANIFGAGSFLPTTLFGWLILIILVLILVLLGNHIYGRFSDTPNAH